MYTSKNLSKKIVEAGFDEWSDKVGRLKDGKMFNKVMANGTHRDTGSGFIKIYDIIYDICIKYPVSFFDKEKIKEYTEYILSMLRNNKSQNKIERFIWKKCLLNKNNVK